MIMIMIIIIAPQPWPSSLEMTTHSGAEQALHAKGSPSARQEVLSGGDQNTNENTEHKIQSKNHKIQNTNIFIKSSTSDTLFILTK